MADKHTHDSDEAHEHDENGEEQFEFVEEPTFEVSDKGECAYEVKTTVPAANTTKQADEILTELTSEAEVPGFRKGKAPRKLVERKFARLVKGEVESKLLAAAFQKLIKDHDLNPLGAPDVDGAEELENRKDDEPLVVTFKFEVSPKVELGTYRGVTVERPVYEVSAKDVEDAIENLRTRYSAFENLEGGVAAEGDQIVITFEGKVDDEPFQGGSATNYPYLLGSKRFYPEFEAVLLGASPGDKLSCEVNFGEDMQREDLKNKKATFSIEVGEVKRRNKPEVNDDFAKQAGFESVDDMKTKLEENLRNHAQEDTRAILETRALDAVIEKSEYQIPKTLIASITEDNIRERVRQLMTLRIPRGEIEAREADIREAAEKDAIANIKRMVALNEIVDAEGIEVTEEDFEEEAASISRSTGVQLEAVNNYLGEAENRNTFESRIARRKAIDLVLQNATITDKTVTHEELHELAHGH